MNLPQTTIDRIEKEAEHAGRMLCSEWPFNAAKIAYSRGATAEATRALPLYEALKEIFPYAAIGRVPAKIKFIIESAIASYESGEPVEEKEPEMPFMDLTGCTDEEKSGLANAAMKTSCTILLNTMKMIGKTNYFRCIAIDPETEISYQLSFARIEAEPGQGKEAKEFAEWVAFTCTPDLNSVGDVEKLYRIGRTGRFFNIGELYKMWVNEKFNAR